MFWIIFPFLMLWFIGGYGWHMANDALNRGSHIEPHLWEATLWFAQWGLWLPTSVTIVAVIIVILIGIGSASLRRTDDRIPTRGERVFSSRQPANDFEPTPEEQEMERRIDDILRRNDRLNKG